MEIFPKKYEFCCLFSIMSVPASDNNECVRICFFLKWSWQQSCLENWEWRRSVHKGTTRMAEEIIAVYPYSINPPPTPTPTPTQPNPTQILGVTLEMMCLPCNYCNQISGPFHWHMELQQYLTTSVDWILIGELEIKIYFLKIIFIT